MSRSSLVKRTTSFGSNTNGEKLQRSSSAKRTSPNSGRRSTIRRSTAPAEVLFSARRSIQSVIEGDLSVRELFEDDEEQRLPTRRSTKSITMKGTIEEQEAKDRRMPTDKSWGQAFANLDSGVDWMIASCCDDPIGCCSMTMTTEAEEAEESCSGDLNLPRLESSGYNMEYTYVDPHLSKVGLEHCVHKFTSVERLFFRQRKADIPGWAKKDRIRQTIQNLKSCDHVNVLHCREAYEDESCIYLFFEDYPCTTLASVLQDEPEWTQDQISNLTRECCAAISFAHRCNLAHVTLSLSHVLLRRKSLPDPSHCKVFGFGLSSFYVNSNDQSIWAPEVVDLFGRYGDSCASRIDTVQRPLCDLWSLGAMIYALVAKRTPQGRRVTFPATFGAVDEGCKTVVEGLLRANPTERTKASQVLLSPWIRKYYKTPNGRTAFTKITNYCYSSLTSRLFAKYLVRFLDADQMYAVACRFFELDHQGDGILDQGDLHVACRLYESERANKNFRVITSHMCKGADKVMSILRFAECMTEEVIDGPSLRHAFENFDLDGSQCLSAQELHHVLWKLDNKLTLQDVVEHMQETTTDAVATADSTADLSIDYATFASLFPMYLQRQQFIQERILSAKTSAASHSSSFDQVKDKLAKWVQDLQDEREQIDQLSHLIVRKNGYASVLTLNQKLKAITTLVTFPPGPAVFEEQQEAAKRYLKSKRKSPKLETFEMDNFAQQQSVLDSWPWLLDEEKQKVKSVLNDKVTNGSKLHVDLIGAHYAAQQAILKLDRVLKWTKGQLEEYKSFLDARIDAEVPLPFLPFSARGVQLNGADRTGDVMDQQPDEDAGGGTRVSVLRLFYSR